MSDSAENVMRYAVITQVNLINVLEALSGVLEAQSTQAVADACGLTYQQARATLASAYKGGWVELQESSRGLHWTLSVAFSNTALRRLFLISNRISANLELARSIVEQINNIASTLKTSTSKRGV